MFEDLPFKAPRSGLASAELKVYALSDCEHCRQGMAFLEARGFPYRYIYVDLLPPESRIRIKKEITSRFQRNLAFPLLELPGDDFLFGFDESEWRLKLVRR